MKKKVVFDKPIDIVGIQDIDLKGFFVAQKGEFQTILTSNGQWLDFYDMSLVAIISDLEGKDKVNAIHQAEAEGFTIHQYNSFWEFCKEYVDERS